MSRNGTIGRRRGRLGPLLRDGRRGRASRFRLDDAEGRHHGVRRDVRQRVLAQGQQSNGRGEDLSVAAFDQERDSDTSVDGLVGRLELLRSAARAGEAPSDMHAVFDAGVPDGAEIFRRDVALQNGVSAQGFVWRVDAFQCCLPDGGRVLVAEDDAAASPGVIFLDPTGLYEPSGLIGDQRNSRFEGVGGGKDFAEKRQVVRADHGFEDVRHGWVVDEGKDHFAVDPRLGGTEHEVLSVERLFDLRPVEQPVDQGSRGRRRLVDVDRGDVEAEILPHGSGKLIGSFTAGGDGAGGVMHAVYAHAVVPVGERLEVGEAIGFQRQPGDGGATTRGDEVHFDNPGSVGRENDVRSAGVAARSVFAIGRNVERQVLAPLGMDSQIGREKNPNERWKSGTEPSRKVGQRKREEFAVRQDQGDGSRVPYQDTALSALATQAGWPGAWGWSQASGQQHKHLAFDKVTITHEGVKSLMIWICCRSQIAPVD